MSTMISFHYYHSPRFKEYDFGAGHAFDPIRQELTFDLVKEAGFLPNDSIAAPREASDDEIALFHSPRYIETVRCAGSGAPSSAYQLYGLGTLDNPLFPNMHEATAVRVGATLDAVRGVISGRCTHAANFAGGLHHADRDRASGFCVYNDIGVAIAWLRKTFDCRVAYVDVDAHHGDGVQWGFYDDPEVLTVSIHESGRFLFPGTGGVDEQGSGAAKGTSVNIPLLPHTGDRSWSECFHLVVPEVVGAFRPDILISQHGCDAHRRDPLAHLEVSTHTLVEAARTLHRLAEEVCEGRWVALGGGGYAVWDVVPRAWGLIWAEIVGADVGPDLPAPWVDRWRERSPVPLGVRWQDEALEQTETDDSLGDRIRKENLETAKRSLNSALAYLTKRKR